jgi:hypothetical protein
VTQLFEGRRIYFKPISIEVGAKVILNVALSNLEPLYLMKNETWFHYSSNYVPTVVLYVHVQWNIISIYIYSFPEHCTKFMLRVSQASSGVIYPPSFFRAGIFFYRSVCLHYLLANNISFKTTLKLTQITLPVRNISLIR